MWQTFRHLFIPAFDTPQVSDRATDWHKAHEAVDVIGLAVVGEACDVCQLVNDSFVEAVRF